MITKTFVEEIKHTITWFVNVYDQYNNLLFLQWGGLDTVFLKPHFGHPVMKILAKTLLPTVFTPIVLVLYHKICMLSYPKWNLWPFHSYLQISSTSNIWISDTYEIYLRVKGVLEKYLKENFCEFGINSSSSNITWI